MKTVFFSALLLTTAAVWAAPSLSIDKAAAVAQQELRDRKLDGKRYVASISLESDSVSGSRPYWYARWSESIQGDEKKRELGLRISMDGTVVRVVETPGAGREALREHRTRADRPSVLDLKH